MTERIFKYIEFIILFTLISALVGIMIVVNSFLKSVQYDQLKSETEFAAQAVEQNGIDYLKTLKLKDNRVTWVDPKGKVLFDNQADSVSMPNHAERPEIKDALDTGSGRSTRYSNTLTKVMLYYAVRLSDGSVLRISESRDTVLAISIKMLQPMVIVFLFLLIITYVFSSKTVKNITEPLNSFNLDQPLENDEYPELSPFLKKIYDQQKEIESQKISLLHSEKDFAAVTANMSEGLMLLSYTAKVLMINKKAKKLFSADHKCIGKDVLFLERRVEFEQALRTAQDGKHAELKLDYSGHVYQIDITPVFSEDTEKDTAVMAEDENTIAGMVVLLFDVTDREKAESMRMEFTSNVSHELKTPLHTISGCAELLESGGVKSSDQKKFVHTIYVQAQRMIALVEDIIYISHLDEGSIDMNWEKIDLKNMVSRVVEQIKSAADRKHVSITVTGTSPEFPGIYRLVDSIVFNLIDNAIKYNKDGGNIVVTLVEDEDTVNFSVQDTGIGIPDEEIPRIFERFYRVDKSHSREIGGTGLGLSIVKHASEILGAHVDVESEIGKGTTFTVEFRKQV